MNVQAKISAIFLLSVYGLAVQAQKPIKRYLDKLPALTTKKVTGNARILKADGRIGIQTTGVNSTIELPSHNLNEGKGSVAVWVVCPRNLKVYNKSVPFQVMDIIGKYPSKYGK